jgi:hypothetical protein
MFVNDAIGYDMSPEQILWYSDNAYGTADAICFRDNILRIHDLKTGITPGKPAQLEVYAAIFCLEYDYDPRDIDIYLRIYQSDEVVEWEPNSLHISDIMDIIIEYDIIIEKTKKGES